MVKLIDAQVSTKKKPGKKTLNTVIYDNCNMSGDRYIISDQNAIYFLTFTIVGWIDVFTKKEYRLEVVNSMNYCIKNKGLVIYAWCIMSNHLHLIARADEGSNMSNIIRDFKKYTAKSIIKLIQNNPESRRSWMLNQFEFVGRKLKRKKAI